MLKGFHPERLSVNLLRGRQATRTLHTPQDLQSLLASSTKSTLPQTCHPHIKARLVLQHGRPRVVYERHSIQSHRHEEQEHGSWRKAGSSFGFERAWIQVSHLKISLLSLSRCTLSVSASCASAINIPGAAL